MKYMRGLVLILVCFIGIQIKSLYIFREKMDLFQSPQLMVNEDGEPRIIDTIFNVTGIVNNLFNTSNNALVTYVGGLVLFIVLLGNKLKHYFELNIFFMLQFLELALYFLDVYYNQTFTSSYSKYIFTLMIVLNQLWLCLSLWQTDLKVISLNLFCSEHFFLTLIAEIK